MYIDGIEFTSREEQRNEALSFGSMKGYKSFLNSKIECNKPKKIDTATEFGLVDPEENVKSSIIL